MSWATRAWRKSGGLWGPGREERVRETGRGQESKDFFGHDKEMKFYSKYNGSRLPWWRRGEESACQCTGHRCDPWSGKIPHAVEQLNPQATTTEPARHNY